MDYWKPPQKFIDQYRSWRVMEKYFGVTQPGTHSVSFDLRKILPPEGRKVLHSIQKKALEYEIERIKLN